MNQENIENNNEKIIKNTKKNNEEVIRKFCVN